MYQSWAHIPSQQQQSYSLVVVSDASCYYSVFSCLYVITVNQSVTLEAHIQLTLHYDLSQTHFFLGFILEAQPTFFAPRCITLHLVRQKHIDCAQFTR